MPRNRPGAVRAAAARPPLLDPCHGRIDRLSERTSAEIWRAERLHDDLWPGITRAALRTCRMFLRRPGRYLMLVPAECGCPGCELADDVAIARDALETVLYRLSPRARAELGRVVGRVDAELRRRTLPDPNAWRSPWRAQGRWWHRRLYERQ
ncbi:hypothetical protein [Streptomyces chattanoogensis]|uniref:hypothetical protein n=1 Tax=Streptomyces chattanoogensis TaxID=66876 RepID=UPI0036B8F11F